MARSKLKKGVTLVEILIVISILMILGGLLFPAFSQAKASAKDRACASNLGQVYRAFVMYMADHDDHYPRGKDCFDRAEPWIHPPELREDIRAMLLLPDLLHPYTKSKRVWECPRDSGVFVFERQFPMAIELAPTAFQSCGMSYEYRTVLGLSSLTGTTIQDVAGANIFHDMAGHWHSTQRPLRSTDNYDAYQDARYTFRYNLLYADGHVKLVPKGEVDNAWGKG